MTPIRDWEYNLEEYVPCLFIFALYVLVWPVRVVVLALLPPGASYKYHKLHKIHDFLSFR